MTIKETPNKITAVLKVTATAEFFDDEASEETVRYMIEQDLEDAGFDVDVALLKEQEPVKPIHPENADEPWFKCGSYGQWVDNSQFRFCPWCGKKVKWSV